MDVRDFDGRVAHRCDADRRGLDRRALLMGGLTFGVIGVGASAPAFAQAEASPPGPAPDFPPAMPAAPKRRRRARRKAKLSRKHARTSMKKSATAKTPAAADTGPTPGGGEVIAPEAN